MWKNSIYLFIFYFFKFILKFNSKIEVTERTCITDGMQDKCTHTLKWIIIMNEVLTESMHGKDGTQLNNS